MPLEILVIMVVAGVSLIVAVVAFSGLSHTARFDDEDHARRLLTEEFPDATFGEGIVSGDGRAAFFRCGNDRIAVAAGMGDRYVLRLFERKAVRPFAVKGDGAAKIRFDDFTFPALRVRFAKADDAENMNGWLEESHV